MAGDESVDPVGIRRELSACLRAELCQGALRNLPEPQRSVLDVKPERPLAKNFRKFPFCQPPAQVHLPQAVLSSHVTLCEEQGPGPRRHEGEERRVRRAKPRQALRAPASRIAPSSWGKLARTRQYNHPAPPTMMSRSRISREMIRRLIIRLIALKPQPRESRTDLPGS